MRIEPARWLGGQGISFQAWQPEFSSMVVGSYLLKAVLWPSYFVEYMCIHIHIQSKNVKATTTTTTKKNTLNQPTNHASLKVNHLHVSALLRLPLYLSGSRECSFLLPEGLALTSLVIYVFHRWIVSGWLLSHLLSCMPSAGELSQVCCVCFALFWRQTLTSLLVTFPLINGDCSTLLLPAPQHGNLFPFPCKRCPP